MEMPSELKYSTNSPPIILDLSMSEQLDADPDFEFFDSTALDSANSPGQFIDDLGPENNSQFLTSLLSPKNQSPPEEVQPLRNSCQPSLSASLTNSPVDSYQDSSSDSSDYPRKSSSSSLTSALTPGDIIMGDDSEFVREWNMLSADENTNSNSLTDGCIDPSAMDATYLSGDNGFDQDFNFRSSASSPSFKAGIIGMESPEMATIRTDTPSKHSMAMLNNFKVETNSSQNVVMPPAQGSTTARSREASPISAMVSGKGSPPTFFPSPSPGVASLCSMEYMNSAMLGSGSTIPKWAMNTESYQNNGLPTPQRSQQINSRVAPPPSFPMTYPLKNILTIHPTPLKSRVETQIPIKMTLFPLPIGITKLHLPTHTISKPKLLAKPTPDRSPDTLELYTSLVCTSAMQNPEIRKRAFERAAASARTPMSPREEPEGSGNDEDDENKPSNGGEVKICGGCIIRERKRAARKKSKKAEEEESWQKYETQRVIVFNTHEIKEWQAPSQTLPSEISGDNFEPYVPEGGMQVDAPMRIACYCRHQNEKSGFQVIFTIKDHQDKLVAQAITSSIMITDDHKTSAVPPINPQLPNGNELFMGPSQFGEANFDINFALTGNPATFRMSHSSSDLQALQQRSTSIEMKASSNSGGSPRLSQSSTSTSLTPQILGPTSPTAIQGPLSKKRKASGSNKLPTGLAMTRLETGENHPINSSASSVPSPFTPSFPNFPGSVEQQFSQTNNLHNISTHFNGPPTPNSTGQMFSHINRSQSMDSQAMQPIYSTPGSGIPSRVSSPSGSRLDNYQRQQAHLAQAVANGLYGIPMNINPHRPPVIHKMIPSEGPKAGGIEVTCLGSGFVQGLEVMFGDSKATTTTFWGETSLVCLLPPSSFAGNYPVTFKHQHQHQHIQHYPVSLPKQQTYFKYVDDDELQILRTALSVLGHKMTGKMEDVRDLARRIVGDSGPSWTTSNGPTSGPSQTHGGTGFKKSIKSDMSLESILLRFLDLIDLDESPTLPRYNLRRPSGQTMLHLACSLGLHQFVAALLARGVNPDPRDKGGFTPMHFAALHNHPHIVRRLLLSGADPTVQSLQGYTPSDMSNSKEILQAVRHISHNSRRRSVGSFNSRASSISSLRSPWEQELIIPHSKITINTESEDNSYSEDSDDCQIKSEDSWIKQRSCSSGHPTSQALHDIGDNKASILNHSGANLDATGRPTSSSAAILALRGHISAQIQQLQQIMHSNLPHIPQIPRFDIMSQILTLQDYQAYLPNPNPMVRRITNLVQRPGSPKEQDYKWWDLFSPNAPSAPPAYEDIFPPTDPASQISPAFQTTVDNVADSKSGEVDVITETSILEKDITCPIRLDTVRIGHSLGVSQEQQEQIRLAHAKKLKRLSRDRNLFFIWIPLLIIIILAMAYNHTSAFWKSLNIVSSLLRRDTLEA